MDKFQKFKNKEIKLHKHSLRLYGEFSTILTHAISFLFPIYPCKYTFLSFPLFSLFFLLITTLYLKFCFVLLLHFWNIKYTKCINVKIAMKTPPPPSFIFFFHFLCSLFSFPCFFWLSFFLFLLFYSSSSRLLLQLDRALSFLSFSSFLFLFLLFLSLLHSLLFLYFFFFSLSLFTF